MEIQETSRNFKKVKIMKTVELDMDMVIEMDMEIMGYSIPVEFQSNNFICSLFDQFETKGTLSKKQVEALENVIGVELEFNDFDFTVSKDHECFNALNTLMKKLKANRFRKVKTRNDCIRAVKSIIDGSPRWQLIDYIINPRRYFYKY